MAKRAKKESQDFIKQQFNLRKQISAARQLEQETIAQISRVRMAEATEKKIAGLQATHREKYLTALIDALKANVDKCKDEPGQQPNSVLKYNDYEAMSVNMEYDVFRQNKVANMYRHALVKEVRIINCHKIYMILLTSFSNRYPQSRNSQNRLNYCLFWWTIFRSLKQVLKVLGQVEAWRTLSGNSKN